MAKAYFWDSCIFIAFLENNTAAYDIGSIEHFLDDAKAGKCEIHGSTLLLTEIKPSFLVKKNIGSFTDFVNDYSGAIKLMDPNPIICEHAGRIRDLKFCKNKEMGRQLATPDAIMLSTAIYLEDIGVPLEAFHTFDRGKKRGLEGGKGIPLLDFHEWCDGLQGNVTAERVIDLKRSKPIHPTPRLALVKPEPVATEVTAPAQKRDGAKEVAVSSEPVVPGKDEVVKVPEATAAEANKEDSTSSAPERQH